MCSRRACVVALVWLLSAAPLLSAKAAPQTVWHVAVDGNDQQPGTPEAPLKSVHRAVELIRAARAAGTQGELTVALQPGTYYLSAPLELGPADGDVTFRAASDPGAAPPARVILSGGAPITGWQRQGELLETTLTLAEGEAPPRTLFINGRRATRARTPNEGFYRVVAAGPDNRTSFTFNPGELKAWSDVAQAELVFLHDWSTSRVPLKSIDTASNTLHVATPIGCAAPHYTISHFEPHPRYFIENAAELLDAPGEWHFDAATGRLRYWPLGGEMAETLVALRPMLEGLLQVRGTDDAPVRNLKFKNLAFQHCRWLPPKNGYADGQATFHERRDNADHPTHRAMIPAAVTLDQAENCQFEGCEFSQLDGGAIHVRQTCRDNALVNCKVDDIGGNGIMIGETITRGPVCPPDDPRNLLARDNRVERCTVTRCGQSYYGAVGIWIGITARTQILNNEISQMPYTGVSLGWRWDPGPSGAAENVIAENHIHHCLQLLSDGGGIYTLGLQTGGQLRGNRIHNIPLNAGRAESNGIFMDEGTTGLLVIDNTIYNLDRSPIRFHRAGVNTLRNNRLTAPPNTPMFRYNATPEHMVLENNRSGEGGEK